MIKYKFAVDPSLVSDIKAFLQKNPTLFTITPEIKQNANISAHVKFSTDNETSLFKFHKFLLKIHHIESTLTENDLEEPIIPITLSGSSGYKAYFNYVLSSLLCQYLRESSIKFSTAKNKRTLFSSLGMYPCKITKKDFNKVKQIMARTPLSNYHIINPLIHIIADT